MDRQRPNRTAAATTARAALSEVAQALGNRVRPLSLARERVLPVDPALVPVFPEGGLRRGSVIGCQGLAPWSTALALCAAASQAGSWVAWVGCAPLGLSAAAEWGIALDRLLAIPEVPAAQRATVLAAVADGVDLVVTGDAGIRAADARKLQARLMQRGGVLIVVGDPGGLVPDLVCSVDHSAWTGLGDGHGRLVARRVRFQSSGRRADRPRCIEVGFPGECGSVAPVDTPVAPGVPAVRTVADAVRSA